MFKWLFGKSPSEPAVDPAHQALLDAALEKMDAMTKPAVRLFFTPGAPVPDAPVSSIGGQPSLAGPEDWPRDENGNAMTFLAQLNYADLPPLEGWPEAGLLSFFVKDEDVFGCAFPSLDQKGFRLIWEEKPEGLTRQAPPERAEGYSPFGLELERHGAPLRGALSEGPPSPASVVAEEISRHWPKDFPVRLEDAFSEHLLQGKPGNLYYGAHPDFTQQDYRYGERASLTEVLLQIGMVTPDEHGWQIMFGDAGEAQFMATAEDLRARRFENAVWNWDCC